MALMPLFNGSKLAQDVALGTLLHNAKQHNATDSTGSFTFAGLELCKVALLRVLGTTRARAVRISEGKYDTRFGKREKGDPRGHQLGVYSHIYSHLWHTYESVAEHMPDEPLAIDHDPFKDDDATYKQLQVYQMAVS